MELTCPAEFHPELKAPEYVKRLMEIGLKNFDRIDFGDLGFGFSNPFTLLCQILEIVGDDQTAGLLETLASDQQKGPDAIRKIKQRLRCPGTV
jgi:hypothetical protein